ncbi:MAG: TauD/TfdA family dioxygenase [Rhodospirillales bacterium]
MADASDMPEIAIAPDGATLLVLFPDADPLPIHPLWLRERCSDAASLDAQTEQRLYNPSDLDPAATISQITKNRCRRGFKVAFRDGGSGCFTPAAIRAELPTCVDAILPPPVPMECRQPAAAIHRLAHLPGGGRAGSRAARLPRSWLISSFATCRREPARFWTWARRFGFPRETNFGMLFDVRSVPHANDLANTSLPLDPHTDNPYRAPVPGNQLLHCLTNRTPGGLSTLVDGLAVAEVLRAEAPPLFES